MARIGVALIFISILEVAAASNFSSVLWQVSRSVKAGGSHRS